MDEALQNDLERFTIRPYRSKRLREYCTRMSQNKEAVIYDDNVADMLKAQGFVWTESPRSIYKVDLLYKALSRFAPGKVGPPQRSSFLYAGKTLARICFSRPKDVPFLDILPMTPKTVVDVTSNPGGSAGLTAYGCTKHEAMTRALERGLQTLDGSKVPEPCLAFARTQFNDKTRLVWGYPYSMTLIEGLLAKPLIELFKGWNTPMAFGLTSMALGTKLRTAAYHKRWAYSIDMSSYDASLSAHLIHEAFKILKTWFDQSQVEPVSGKTVAEIFEIIEHYFIHTPIVMPDSRLYLGKRHGVPSGSFFTQIIDSICNVIIAGTISARFNLHVSKREIFVLGDDLLFWTDRDIDLSKIARFASATFGVEFNPTKSSKFKYDEKIHYLGRDWDRGIPSLDESEILKRMVFPERYRKYAEDPADRRRQVRMLILSYACVYWGAWSIANKLYGSNVWYRMGGASIDIGTYCRDGQNLELDPELKTGLERYLDKYVRVKIHGDIPNTGMQFWL